MITLLIGHRGTGKSSLLKRLSRYRPGSQCLDLDRWIEESQGLTIEEIFRREEGEEGFRRVEEQSLARLLDSVSGEAYIALGAGFRGELPRGARVLWVRRDTDSWGRVFLNRVRLDRTVSPLEEYQARFNEREARYERLAHETLTLREGTKGFDAHEEAFFCDSFAGLGGLLTVLPGKADKSFLSRRLKWGVERVELRNDLLSRAEIDAILKALPPERLLVSFRPNAKAQLGPADLPAGVMWDWDLSLGAAPAEPSIYSLHPGEHEPLSDSISSLARIRSSALLKLAPLVKNFVELERGHEWRELDPRRHVFFPQSLKPVERRWAWYRLLQTGPQFIREGKGSSLDQPTLLEWAARPALMRGFAAVLGQPVLHSHSPVEHEAYFKKRSMPFVSIPLSLEEIGSLPFLARLGLRHAAVTSPLKERMRQLSTSSQGYDTVNTISYDGQWRATNTDLAGLESLFEGLSLTGEIAVWGGGGTLPVLERVLPPHTSYYSARSGQLRRGPTAQNPRIVVWAAGREHECRLPTNWSPDCIVDLSYREDSGGRSYALAAGSRYRSGETMFLRQALEQRKFWSRYEPCE